MNPADANAARMVFCGDVNIPAFRFDHLFTVISIDLFMLNPLEVWVADELDVQVSSDTTDGFDGSWSTLASRPGDTPDNVATVDFAPVASEWLRLRKEYQGRSVRDYPRLRSP